MVKKSNHSLRLRLLANDGSAWKNNRESFKIFSLTKAQEFVGKPFSYFFSRKERQGAGNAEEDRKVRLRASVCLQTTAPREKQRRII
jgi:hypothetical protein